MASNSSTQPLPQQKLPRLPRFSARRTWLLLNDKQAAKDVALWKEQVVGELVLLSLRLVAEDSGSKPVFKINELYYG
jgi:hypothetical protein